MKCKKRDFKISNFIYYVISIITREDFLLVMNENMFP